SAPDDFAKGQYIGFDSVITGCAFKTYAESGYDLIKDEQCLVPGTEIAYFPEVVLPLNQKTIVGGNGFYDHCSNIGMLGKAGFQGTFIIERKNQSFPDKGI